MKIVNIARVMIILIRFSSYIGFGQGSLGWHMLEGFFVCLFLLVLYKSKKKRVRNSHKERTYAASLKQQQWHSI